MLKKCVKKIGGSLTMQIFLITATILATACTITYGFIVWATPISYTTIVNSDLAVKASALAKELEQTTLAECGPLVDYFTANTGGYVRVSDQNGNTVALPSAVEVHGYSAAAGDVEGVTSEFRSAIRDVRQYEVENRGFSVVTGKAEDASGESGSTIRKGKTVASSAKDVFSATGPSDRGNTVLTKASREQEADESVVVTSDVSEYVFSFKGSSESYTMTVLSSVTAANQTVEALGRVLPFLVIVVLVVSLLGAVIYSQYITRPIVRLSSVSQKMASLDFHWKCNERRTDEIGVLGRNLDDLSDRLSTALHELQTANEALQNDIDRERELEQQRMTFFSAASHELKTPITVLKGQLSGMLAGVDIYKDREKYLARALAVTNRMEGLVQEVLTISRMEHIDVPVKKEWLNLSVLAENQAQQAMELAQQREQTLDVQIEPEVLVRGERALLQRAVGNLLSNALLYSPEGETISVRLSQENGRPAIVIVNGGSFLAEDAIPHLFEAFYRVESSRNRRTGGSGLGLYIVKMILDRHKAEYRLENTPEGVRATVLFPPQ